MDNDRQSSLPSSLLPHLYTAPNQPRDSGTRTTIGSDDEHTETFHVSPVQFPYAPPRRVYPQTVQPHPQQQQQRPFLPYDLNQQSAAEATHDVAHQQQFMYDDPFLPSSTRPIMPVGRATAAYSYPPLHPPTSRQLPSSANTGIATRTTWSEGEPGPSSLLHHPQHQDSRTIRHRRGESLSPRALPHIDPFSRRTANYEHDPSSFGHVVRRNTERDPYFSSLPGPPAIPQHQQYQQHQQNQQHLQHQSDFVSRTVSNYFAQQPQPHSQNYPNQQQHQQSHSHQQQYQYQQQHQHHALSASQSLSLPQSQHRLFLPDTDNDTASLNFRDEPQSYNGNLPLSLDTPPPQFRSSSGSTEGSSSYALYHRSNLPTASTHLDRSDNRLNANDPSNYPTHPDRDRLQIDHIDMRYGLERADRAAGLQHTKPWYEHSHGATARGVTDLKHGILFSEASLRDTTRARMEGLSRALPVVIEEGSGGDRDREKEWEKSWNQGGGVQGMGVGVGVAPVAGEGGSGGGGGRRSRNRNRTTPDKRRRADVGDADELARHNKGAAIQQRYKHDQKVWQREEAQAKRPKKTLVACDFCRGRKLRCDGTRPDCSHCIMRGLPCTYAVAPKRRGPGKAPRGSRAKKNAEARAIAESSVVFKNGVDASAFKARPPRGGGTRGVTGRKGGAGVAAKTPWPASLVGMKAGSGAGAGGGGGMVQEGAGFGMGGPPMGTRLHANAVAEEHEYELGMLAPEVRPYASVIALDTLGSAPPPYQRRPYQAGVPTLRGYDGSETVYGGRETGASGLASGMGAPGIAGGTAAGCGGDLDMNGGRTMRRSGRPMGASLSLNTSAGPGSVSVSGGGGGTYGFEPHSPAPHYPPAPLPDRRYDTSDQARAFRDDGGEGDSGSAAGMNDMGGMQSMNMDMGGGGMMGEMNGGDGGPGSVSAYNYSRERTVTRGERSTSAGSETERNE